jgi:hypothetical protein
MKHDHWNHKECGCRVEDPHSDLAELSLVIIEYLEALDAQKRLDNGFTGMGYNILGESAARAPQCIHKMKRLVGWTEGYDAVEISE